MLPAQSSTIYTRYHAQTLPRAQMKDRPSLPYDLLLLIISELTSTSSHASLAKLQRCCKSYYSLITPLLYRSVHSHSDEQLQRFLTIEGGRKGIKAARSHSKSISLTMTGTSPEPLSPAKTVAANSASSGRSRAHSVGSVVRGLGLESPKMVEKRKAKEEAQRRQFAQRAHRPSVSAGASPYTSPHSSQLDLTAYASSGSGLTYTKSEALWLVESLTLDVYPSRTSLKLASKLSTNINAALPRTSKLTLTPKALVSLHAKLAQSQAPRIIAEYWASHATALLRPKTVIVDYAQPALDIRALLDGESKEGWLDAMWGISVMIQQYGEVDLTLKGDVWGTILPAPGAKVRMEHINIPTPSSTRPRTTTPPQPVLAAPMAGQAQAQPATAVVAAAAAVPVAPAPVPPVDPAVAARVELLKERRVALVLGLRSSYAIAGQARSTTSLKWEAVDFFPPRELRSGAASIMTYDTLAMEEDEQERNDVVRALLADLDQQCPDFTRRWALLHDVDLTSGSRFMQSVECQIGMDEAIRLAHCNGRLYSII